MEWTSVVRGSLARPWPRLLPKPEHSIQCGTRQLTKLERSVLFGTRQLTRPLTRQFTRQFSGPGCMQARPKLDSLGEGGEERCGLDLLHEARAVEGFAYRALMGGERHEAVQGDQRRSAEVSRGDPRHTRRSEAIRGSQQRRSEALRGVVIRGFVIRGFVIRGFVIRGFVIRGFVIRDAPRRSPCSSRRAGAHASP